METIINGLKQIKNRVDGGTITTVNGTETLLSKQLEELLKEAINYTHSCTELPSRDCVKKISNEKFNEWRKSAGIDYESHYLGFVSGVNWMFFDYPTK